MSSTLPLQRFTIAETTDPEEAKDTLSQELTNIRIRRIADRGRFRLRMNGLRLGDTLVGFNQFDVHTEVEPGEIEDSVAFVVGHGTHSVFHVDGEPVATTPTTAAVLSPSRWVRIERPADAGILVVRTSPSALAERFRDVTGRSLPEPLVFDRRVDLSRGLGAAVSRILRFVISELEGDGPVLGHAALQSGLEDMLLGALLTLPSNVSDLLQRDCRGQARSSLVRVAEEFMDAYAGEGISVSDVRAACDCSRSQLFKAFRQHRDHTPMQFLADKRLENARKRLMSGSGHNVTSIAFDCGFNHLSRFAAAYKKRFGETPSETRRKHGEPAPE